MEYSIKTHQGKRKTNQDFPGVYFNQSNVLLALLADGLGGHQAGDIASEMAVSQLGNSWEQTAFDEESLEAIKKWLIDKINQENKRIYEAANKHSDLKGMGTTLVAAVILKDEVLICNIGDSRAYRYKGKYLEQITEDHSFVSELQRKGELTEEEAKNHCNKNALTRSLGVSGEVTSDFFLVLKSKVDTIILNSDGLTNAVENKEIIALLANSELSLDKKTSGLIQSAIENEGSDNITVILLLLKEGIENNSKKKWVKSNAQRRKN
ncbi:MAG: Stp1/IreP family PP2C-type Ser/Thr phosphatase [Atopostipes suicloacalis]|nr:Stp1/IreP family PP2C-type Ser/Thr phosphatase [Atopostipes suicloacalis]MDN6730840.1 Stp1/IreP family PP2C-type Ser/Thr phosphatase [Atopostipes suicloacalis]